MSSKINLIKKIAFSSSLIGIVIVMLSTSGCDKLSPTLKEELAETFCSLPWVCKDKNRVILDVATYNYTDYDITEDAEQAPDKNDIKTAAAGAIIWNKKQKPPVLIKVWWMVIFNESLLNHGAGYSSHDNKNAPPGAVWCESIVRIKEPYPPNPQQLNIHFFPDGHVEAEVSESSGSIVSEEQKAKLPRLPAGRYCEKMIENPWYGVDTNNPWE